MLPVPSSPQSVPKQSSPIRSEDGPPRAVVFGVNTEPGSPRNAASSCSTQAWLAMSVLSSCSFQSFPIARSYGKDFIADKDQGVFAETNRRRRRNRSIRTHSGCCGGTLRESLIARRGSRSSRNRRRHSYLRACATMPSGGNGGSWRIDVHGGYSRQESVDHASAR